MVIQVLNPNLGITLRVLVTSATILRQPYTKIHKHGLNRGIMTYH